MKNISLTSILVTTLLTSIGVASAAPPPIKIISSRYSEDKFFEIQTYIEYEEIEVQKTINRTVTETQNYSCVVQQDVAASMKCKDDKSNFADFSNACDFTAAHTKYLTRTCSKQVPKTITETIREIELIEHIKERTRMRYAGLSDMSTCTPAQYNAGNGWYYSDYRITCNGTRIAN